MTYSASVIKRIPLVFFLEVKKCLVLFNLPVSRARPEKLCNFFFGCNFESSVSQVGLHKQKKDTASARDGKVRLLRR